MTRETKAFARRQFVEVLPLLEVKSAWRVKFGPFALLVYWRPDTICLGFTVLRAGVMFYVGPVYFAACHVSRQLAAFDAEASA